MNTEMSLFETLDQEATDFMSFIKWFIRRFDNLDIDHARSQLYNAIESVDEAIVWAKYFGPDRHEEILNFVNTSEEALAFAQAFPSYRSLVIDRIDDIKSAVAWALTWSGDRKRMMNFMVDDEVSVRDENSHTPYFIEWAIRYPEDRPELLKRIQCSRTAYFWADNIERVDSLTKCITESRYALAWARKFGDISTMRKRITDESSAFKWVLHIGDYDVMINHIESDRYRLLWALRWPEEHGFMVSRISTSDGAVAWIRAYFEPMKIGKKTELRHSNHSRLKHDIKVLQPLVKNPEDVLEWCRMLPDHAKTMQDLVFDNPDSSEELMLEFAVMFNCTDRLKGKTLNAYPRLSKLFC